MSSRPAAIVGALLVGLHGWLLAVHAWTGQLADPALALRWAAAAGLLAGLTVLHRRGLSLWSGRRAVAIWLLAAVLHAPALADRAGHASPALPEAVVTLVGAATASLGLLGSLALSGFPWRRGRAPLGTPIRPADRGLRPSRRALLHRLSPRPPPILASVRS